ncbi:MAG: helix-turn-helix domain-containing protein [Gracilibacteraceae bacterium]|jgi:hypothetical protein|nr:helix-turn-helix domain-containing protein [Gracilibacteraceae bacterium]
MSIPISILGDSLRSFFPQLTVSDDKGGAVFDCCLFDQARPPQPGCLYVVDETQAAFVPPTADLRLFLLGEPARFPALPVSLWLPPGAARPEDVRRTVVGLLRLAESLNSHGTSAARDPAEVFLTAALHRHNQFGAEMAAGLSRLGWLRQDRYQVAVVKPPAGQGADLNGLRLCLSPQLDARFAELGGAVVAVVNSRAYSRDLSDPVVQQSFRHYLRQSGCIGGCSFPAADFDILPDLYTQASFTAAHCSEADSDYPLAFYENYMLSHLARIIIDAFGYRAFVRPDIEMLHELDRDLLRTLFVYLSQDKSYSRTRQKLHVCSSSVSYRLNKIRALIGESVFESEARFSVLISAAILALMEGGGVH